MREGCGREAQRVREVSIGLGNGTVKTVKVHLCFDDDATLMRNVFEGLSVTPRRRRTAVPSAQPEGSSAR